MTYPHYRNYRDRQLAHAKARMLVEIAREDGRRRAEKDAAPAEPGSWNAYADTVYRLFADRDDPQFRVLDGGLGDTLPVSSGGKIGGESAVVGDEPPPVPRIAESGEHPVKPPTRENNDFAG